MNYGAVQEIQYWFHWMHNYDTTYYFVVHHFRFQNTKILVFACFCCFKKWLAFSMWRITGITAGNSYKSVETIWHRASFHPIWSTLCVMDSSVPSHLLTNRHRLNARPSTLFCSETRSSTRESLTVSSRVYKLNLYIVAFENAFKYSIILFNYKRVLMIRVSKSGTRAHIFLRCVVC